MLFIVANQADADYMASNMPSVYWIIIVAFGILHLWLLFANNKIEKQEG